MNIFELTLAEFSANKITKKQSAIYQNKPIKWEFISLEQIVNKQNFITYLQMSFGYEFSYLMVNKIDDKIIEIRNLFSMTNQAASRYLFELEDEKRIEIIYKQLLQELYIHIKNFINHSLIEFIFNDALQEEKIIFNQNFDNEKYYQYEFNKLSLDFQKTLKALIKSITKLNKNDITFLLLLDHYKEDIDEKETLLKRMLIQSQK